MLSFLERPKHLNLKPIEAIWLEPEQLTLAVSTVAADPTDNEDEQWQRYLNALAQRGFLVWLQNYAFSFSIDQTHCINYVDAIYTLQVNRFRLNLIVREQVLDEVVEIHREVIEKAQQAAHFYVLLEVLEEQKCVMIRGFLRYDRLMDFCNSIHPQHDYYRLPLSVWDADPDHLLFYCHFLDPASITLPTIASVLSTPAVLASASGGSQDQRVSLKQWIEGIFTDGWYAIDTLLNTDIYRAGNLRYVDTYLASNLRNAREGAKRGKLIDLGMELPGQSVVLLVNVTEISDQELSVVVQLHPVGEVRYLMPGIGLMLLSQTGKMLQDVRSRTQDNYIQLKPFQGRSGIPFSIEISLGNYRLREDFQL